MSDENLEIKIERDLEGSNECERYGCTGRAAVAIGVGPMTCNVATIYRLCRWHADRIWEIYDYDCAAARDQIAAEAPE